MSTVESVVKDYKETLGKLDRNDKVRINVLTILAEDYAKYAPHIVKIIEQSILEVETDALRLVRLYLMDSIIKNVRKAGNYAEIFSNNLVKVFLHVFERGDEKVRASLFKLRNTWQDIFPRGKLYSLDLDLRNIDPKWPIALQRNGAPPQPQKPQPRSEAPQPIVVKSEPKPHSPTLTDNSKPTEAVKRPADNLSNGTKIFVNPNFVKQEAAKDQPAEKKRREESPPRQDKQISVQEKKPVRVQDNKSPRQEKSTQPKTQTRTQQNKKPTTPPEGRRSPKLQANNIPMKPPTVELGAHAFVPPTIQSQPVVTRSISPNVLSAISTSIPINVPPPVNSFTPIASTGPGSTPPMRFPRPFVPQHQIRNEAPRLNLPSNNRIFVDGKAYEVFYLDNVAVIERNGVPHRISFCGPPRDVIIDGSAHRMSFGETKAVMIDGQTHYLRFGAPSRELYMGDFPFKGVFGGPPIAAIINGRRHEIRLCGPPPEVKIEQDPCYELMRQMQNLRQNNTSELSLTKKEDKEIKIGDLLAKLQKTGVLDSLSTAIKSTDKIGSAASTSASSSFPAHRENTPPTIPRNVKMDNFEVREKPTTQLSQFYMPDLKVRYLSVIRSIHQNRSVCPDCGIYFEDMDSASYRNHLDEHIQLDLNVATTIHPMGKSRQRYLNAEAWVAYSKVDAVNRAPVIEMNYESNSENDSDEMEDENAME